MRNSCCRPPAPPCPRPCWLLPRVVGASRDTFRCMAACIAVEGLPCGLRGPFAVLSIEPAGEPRIAPPCGCRSVSRCADAVIPLAVWICDGCGGRFCGTAELRIRVRVPSCPPGANLIAQADVRFIGGDTAPCRPVFDVRLEVCVDVYAVRMEPCGRGERRERPEWNSCF